MTITNKFLGAREKLFEGVKASLLSGDARDEGVPFVVVGEVRGRGEFEVDYAAVQGGAGFGLTAGMYKQWAHREDVAGVSVYLDWFGGGVAGRVVASEM